MSTWISLKPIVFQAYHHSATLTITHPFQQNPDTIPQVAGIDIVYTGIGNTPSSFQNIIVCHNFHGLNVLSAALIPGVIIGHTAEWALAQPSKLLQLHNMYVLVKHETHNYFTGGSSSCMSFSGKSWIMEHGNKKCHYYSNKTIKVLYCGKSNFFIPITCTYLWIWCLSLLWATAETSNAQPFLLRINVVVARSVTLIAFLLYDIYCSCMPQKCIYGI